jgi:hypothetical protein
VKEQSFAEFMRFLEVTATAQERIRVLPIGRWFDYNEIIEITPADAAEIVANFNSDAYGQRIPIEVADHRDFGIGACGWYADLKVEADCITAGIEWNDLGRWLIKQSPGNPPQYMYHSPEIYLRSIGNTYQRPGDGQQFTNLITGDSLTNHPFFKDNEVAAAMFSEARSEHKPFSFRAPSGRGQQPEEQTMVTPADDKTKPAEGSEVKPGAHPEATVSPAEFAELQRKQSETERELNEAKQRAAQTDAALLSERTLREKNELVTRFSEARIGADKNHIMPKAYGEKFARYALRFSDVAPEGLGEDGKPQKSERQEFIEALSTYQPVPVGVVGFGQTAEGGSGSPEAAHAQLKTLAEERQKSAGCSFTQAMMQINRENPDLVKSARGQ